MSNKIKEFKSQLHERIEKTNDENFLESVKVILDQKDKAQREFVLNPYQEKRINDAQKRIDNGDYITNEKADQLVAKWLSK